MRAVRYEYASRWVTWQLGQSILHGFWAKLRAGSFEDGTLGIRPVILYGKASFSATGKGRQSAPTTAMRRACVTVMGKEWVRDADEHRSTKVCSTAICGAVLDEVQAVTPDRIINAKIAKANRELPPGMTPPPMRKISRIITLRGKLHCPSETCKSHAFRHRDGDACRLILRNALSVDRGEGTLPCMRGGIHWEDVKGPPFLLWDP